MKQLKNYDIITNKHSILVDIHNIEIIIAKIRDVTRGSVYIGTFPNGIHIPAGIARHLLDKLKIFYEEELDRLIDEFNK